MVVSEYLSKSDKRRSEIYQSYSIYDLGSSIKYVRKIFRKTIRTRAYGVRSRGLEILVFRNVLRTYLIDGSFIQQE